MLIVTLHSLAILLIYSLPKSDSKAVRQRKDDEESTEYDINDKIYLGKICFNNIILHLNLPSSNCCRSS